MPQALLLGRRKKTPLQPVTGISTQYLNDFIKEAAKVEEEYSPDKHQLNSKTPEKEEEHKIEGRFDGLFGSSLYIAKP
jgi:hypothetical protein